MSYSVWQSLVERVLDKGQFVYHCSQDEALKMRQKFYDWRKRARDPGELGGKPEWLARVDEVKVRVDPSGLIFYLEPEDEATRKLKEALNAEREETQDRSSDCNEGVHPPVAARED